MRVRLSGPSTGLRASVLSVLERHADDVELDDAATLEVLCLESCSRSDLQKRDPEPERDDREVVVVVGELPSPYVMRALIARMAGAVLADAVPAALMPTLAGVAAGQRAFPREFAVALRKPALTPREKQILGLVVLNASNAEIAGRLWVTESAVKNALTTAFGKLGVQSRAEATDLILDPDGGLGLGILRITSDPPGEPEGHLDAGEGLEAERRQ